MCKTEIKRDQYVRNDATQEETEEKLWEDTDGQKGFAARQPKKTDVYKQNDKIPQHYMKDTNCQAPDISASCL